MSNLVRRRSFFASAGAFATVGFVKAEARAAQYEYKHGHEYSVSHFLHTRTLQMWEAVKQETNGRLNVTVFPSSSLGVAPAMLEQLRLGAIQILTLFNPNMISILPLAVITEIGFAFKSAAEATAVMDGPVGTYLRNAYENKGIYVFEKLWDTGMRHVETSNHPIATLADLANLKLGTNSARIVIDLFATLGAAPTPLLGAEWYTGLQTHLVDGVASTLPGFESERYYEVAKYISLTNQMWAGCTMTANGYAWGALPPDIREVVTRNANRFTVLARDDANQQNQAVIARLRSRGLIINTPDTGRFRARLAAY